MEEILASIKRVISEDARVAGSSPHATRSAPPMQADPLPNPDEDDVLELDHVVGEESLVSDDVAAATRQRLAALTAATSAAPVAHVPGGDGPLEAVVRDMLRPMLKEWLDQRLPEIIEDMVAKEIARITGRSF